MQASAFLSIVAVAAAACASSTSAPPSTFATSTTTTTTGIYTSPTRRPAPTGDDGPSCKPFGPICKDQSIGYQAGNRKDPVLVMKCPLRAGGYLQSVTTINQSVGVKDGKLGWGYVVAFNFSCSFSFFLFFLLPFAIFFILFVRVFECSSVGCWLLVLTCDCSSNFGDSCTDCSVDQGLLTCTCANGADSLQSSFHLGKSTPHAKGT